VKIVSGKKMGEIDRQAMDDYAIPGVVLMENAGLHVVSMIFQLFPPAGTGRIVVFCGRGNNGGDGFVISRHLLRLGYHVETWAMGALSSYRGDAAINYDLFLRGGRDVSLVQEGDPFRLIAGLQASDLIVDALLGTGLRRQVTGDFADLIRSINESPAQVLAVDIPSGISADTGEVLGEAVKADYTVTFALPKRGLLLFPGAKYAGQVFVADIGIPRKLTDVHSGGENLVTGAMVQAKLPPRVMDGHKGIYGRLLILAGSKGMTGAAALAGEAALRAGAGLVYAGIAEEIRNILESKLREVIVQGFPGDGQGNLTPGGLEEIVAFAGRCQALAFGPGLDPGQQTLELLKGLLNKISVPMIIDAGGLGALAADTDLLAQKNAPVIVTPHPGEMARLTGMKTADIQQKRWEIAVEKAYQWDSIVVLKGAHTVVAVPDGEIFVNPTGNPVLSTAGSGDVLTGLIAALLCGGLSAKWAAICGVYLHGLAGDLLLGQNGARGHLAGDLLAFIPRAFNSAFCRRPPSLDMPYPIKDDLLK